MIAIFWDFGIMAVDKEKLTISVISSSNSSMQTFNNHVEIGSYPHDVIDDLRVNVQQFRIKTRWGITSVSFLPNISFSRFKPYT